MPRQYCHHDIIACDVVVFTNFSFINSILQTSMKMVGCCYCYAPRACSKPILPLDSNSNLNWLNPCAQIKGIHRVWITSCDITSIALDSYPCVFSGLYVPLWVNSMSCTVIRYEIQSYVCIVLIKIIFLLEWVDCKKLRLCILIDIRKKNILYIHTYNTLIIKFDTMTFYY